MKQYKPIQHPIINVLVFLFFILFMFPFGMVVLNSAKTSKEIINNAMGMPESWAAFYQCESDFYQRKCQLYFCVF